MPPCRALSLSIEDDDGLQCGEVADSAGQLGSNGGSVNPSTPRIGPTATSQSHSNMRDI